MKTKIGKELGTIRKTIEFLQKCKPLLGDNLIEEYYIVTDKLTLLLKDLVKIK